MKRSSLILLCVLVILILLCGCSRATRRTVNTAIDFNVGLQRALNEQLLLNLVRMRFREPALFLNPKHLSGEAKLAITGSMGPSLEINPEGGAAFGGLLPGISGTREYSPSISFSHVSGESQHYHKKVTRDLFNHLLQAQWNVGVLLSIFVERIDTIKNDPRSSSQYDQFLDVTRLLEAEQHTHGLTVVAKSVDETVLAYVPPTSSNIEKADGTESESLPQEKPEPGLALEFTLEKLLELEAQGYDIDLSHGKLSIKKKREVGDMLRSLNSVQKDAPKPSTIVTRSFYDALFFLAQAIDVPATLQKSVKSYGKAYETSVRRLLTIKWSLECPMNAYIATEYKGYCWYIEDLAPRSNDGSLSKDTISLLQMVYMLQGIDVSDSAPVLSVVGL